MKRVFVLLASFLITLTLVAGCTGSSSGIRGPITVGSKIDTEGALLSQIIILMLRDNGFEVVDKSGTGQTPIVRKAIISGEIDIYPEYTGNGAFFFDETDSDIWKDADKGYQRVKQLDKEANNIIWLTPAPANIKAQWPQRGKNAQPKSRCSQKVLCPKISEHGTTQRTNILENYATYFFPHRKAQLHIGIHHCSATFWNHMPFTIIINKHAQWWCQISFVTTQ